MTLPSAHRIFHAAALILRDSGTQFLGLIGLLFVSGVALTLISRWTNSSFRQFRFPGVGLYLFGVIGIPLHELCHAIFAKLFFHNIDSIKWFDPSGKGGSHGVVVHYYNDKNLYHRMGLFFIGMGPVLLAPLFLFGFYSFLVPNALHWQSLPHSPSALFISFFQSLLAASNWSHWTFYLFLYLAICLTSQMELSSEDFKIARGGLFPIFVLLLLFNGAALLFHYDLHLRMVSWFLMGLSLWGVCFLLAVFISFVNLILCYFSLSVLNRLFGHPSINPFQD